MKFYLTVLRSGGMRLAKAQLAQPRLVSMNMAQERGFKLLTAKCCYGGSEVGRIWSTTLVAVGSEHIVLQGLESVGGAGLVQEWRLTPLGNAAPASSDLSMQEAPSCVR